MNNKPKELIKKWCSNKITTEEKIEILNLLNSGYGEPNIIQDTSINTDKVSEFNNIIDSHLTYLSKKID